MPNSPVSGSELETYRKSKKLSQVAIGEMLGVSGPTVNRWEKDEEQEIPETAQKLLRMLIYGEMPFGQRDPQAEALEAEHFWQLKLSLADWHKLEGLAMAGGFVTVRDYLLSLIQEDLQREREESRTDKGWSQGDTITRGEGAVDEVALLSEEEGKPVTTGDGGGALQAGADDFLKRHGEAGAGASGSAPAPGVRRGKIVRVPKGTPGGRR